jgi:myo-inositol-1(or 4)-monophosphatase
MESQSEQLRDVAARRSVLAEALPLAREAATLLLEGFRRALTVRTKSRSDLVTDYDVECEARIRKGLAVRFPRHTMVGEEGGGESSELVWYVDPIDGTTNFAHGHPFFCVAMGLVHRGVPEVGIVIAPALALEWTAVRGGGAMRNGEKCRVSETDSLEHALLSTGFPSWRATRADNNYRDFLALDAASHGVRRCGASAIELAMVADGTYDACWDIGLKPWDIAASTLFVREAGGMVTDFDGSGPDFARFAETGGRVLASNGRLHEQIRQARSGAVPLPPVAMELNDQAARDLRARGEVG